MFKKMSPDKDCFFCSRTIFLSQSSIQSSIQSFTSIPLHPFPFIHTTTEYNTTIEIYYPNLIQIILTLRGIDPLTLQLCILRLLLSHPPSPPTKRRSLVYARVNYIIDHTIQTKVAHDLHWYGCVITVYRFWTEALLLLLPL